MDVFVVFILRRDGHMHPKMNAALISCHFARRPPDAKPLGLRFFNEEVFLSRGSLKRIGRRRGSSSTRMQPLPHYSYQASGDILNSNRLPQGASPRYGIGTPARVRS
jgi:hypothetical protein